MKKLKKVIFGGGGGEMAGPQLYSNFVAPIREKSERSEKLHFLVHPKSIKKKLYKKHHK